MTGNVPLDVLWSFFSLAFFFRPIPIPSVVSFPFFFKGGGAVSSSSFCVVLPSSVFAFFETLAEILQVKLEVALVFLYVCVCCFASFFGVALPPLPFGWCSLVFLFCLSPPLKIFLPFFVAGAVFFLFSLSGGAAFLLLLKLI